MYWLFVGVVVLYYGIGYRLTNIAFRYLRSDVRDVSFLAIYDPSNFRPEGEEARRRALHFWWIGFAVVVAVVITLVAAS